MRKRRYACPRSGGEISGCALLLEQGEVGAVT